MENKNTDIKRKVNKLPQKPGVYLFKDGKGKIIYIGKATSLRARVRSYFLKGNYDAKTKALKRKIANLDYILTDNENEALILEANLVKEEHPRYNVNLKDDKHFPYIKITNEPYPRVIVVRRKMRDGALYFGPYTSAQNMRKTLKTVKKLFKIRNCKLNLPLKKPQKPCLNYEIDRCYAPCIGNISEQEYDFQIQNIILFLKGKRKEIKSKLIEEMNKASEQREFEKAAEYRDQVNAIQEVMKPQKLDMDDLGDRDFVAIAREKQDAIAVTFQFREGVIIGRQQYHLTYTSKTPEAEVIASFLKQYYSENPNIPQEIYIQQELQNNEVNELESWLTKLRAEKSRVKLYAPKIGEKQKTLKLVMKNAELLLFELTLTKEKIHLPKAIYTLKEELHLKKPPIRIDAFDISNLGPTNAVGASVRFHEAKPQKSEYRRFIIKAVDQQDDFAMINEVVKRRYENIDKESENLPDLILIDGGKGQLNAAMKALKDLKLEESVEMISIAKRLDELFIPGNKDAVNLPKTSPSLKLLQRIRDEVHRFAITFHRKRRSKDMRAKVLMDIPGVGKKTQDRLLKKFSSLEEIANTDPAKIQELGKVSKPVSEKIIEFLSPYRVVATILLLAALIVGNGCTPAPRYLPEPDIVKETKKPKPEKPEPTPSQTTETMPEDDIRLDALMGQVNLYLGAPYLYGGTTRNGIDCSGYTQILYKKAFGINLPRTVSDQYKLGESVKRKNLEVGDLVFFNTSDDKQVDHVGVYLGNEKFTHASTTHGVVITPLSVGFYNLRYTGARRLIDDF
ncbi:excinuclease ABC subunit UvrC [bacterium]|nr:excinuclease ABC subunit UvrC [bacterium]